MRSGAPTELKVLGDVTKTVECHHLSSESAKLSIVSIQDTIEVTIVTLVPRVLVPPVWVGPTIGVITVR
jgi:hypothetical protein